QFGDLSGIVTNADQLSGKAGQSLRDHLDGVLRNRRLNQLVGDLELPLQLADLERRVWDREEIHTVFDRLEFRVLRDRLFEYLDPVEDEADEGFEVTGGRLEPADLPAWLTEHAP